MTTKAAPLLPCSIPLAPFSTRDDPQDPPDPPWGVDFMPFSMLIVGDFVQREDPRVLEDRKPRRVMLERLDGFMAEHKLAVSLQLPEQSGPTLLRFRKWSDMEPTALAAQIAAQTALQGTVLASAVQAAYRAPALQRLESMWLGLKRLVERAGSLFPVEMVNCSMADLQMDFEDSPHLFKSGFWRLTHQYNHLGLRPYGAIVLLGDIEPRAGHPTLQLVENVANVAAASHAVVLAEASLPTELADLPADRCSADALRFLALCGPPLLARAATDERPALQLSAAFVAAELVIESVEASGSSWHYPSQTVAGSLIRTTVDTGGRRYLLLGNDGERIRVIHDAGYRLGEERPLSEVWLVARLMREALNVQCRRYLRESTAIDTLVATMNEGLSARLGHLDWLQVELDSPVEIEDRPGWLQLTLHVQLTDQQGHKHALSEPFRFDRRW